MNSVWDTMSHCACSARVLAVRVTWREPSFSVKAPCSCHLTPVNHMRKGNDISRTLLVAVCLSQDETTSCRRHWGLKDPGLWLRLL